MDYEKKYKDALERAKKWYYAPNADKIPTYANRVIEEIFPELKESEDEKIKETLIDYFKIYKKQKECGIKTFFGIPTDNIIAWLEKQGEQKVPTNDFKAKNWYVSEADGKIHDMTYDAADKVEPKNMKDETEIPFDANDSELTEVTYDIPKGFHAEIDDDKVVIKKGDKPTWSEEDERLRNSCIKHIEEELEEIRKDRFGHSEIISDLKESCRERINWLKSLKKDCHDVSENQTKQKSKEEIKTTVYNTSKSDVVEYVYILDYCSSRVIVAKHNIDESISELFKQLGLKENQCHYMTSSNILSIEYINF